MRNLPLDVTSPAADPFALDDVTGGASVLRALPPEAEPRLVARYLRGENPLAAGAELCRRGDARALAALTGAVAYLAPEDLGSLADCGGDAGSSALAAAVLASWLTPAQRVAAAEALGRANVTSASYAALAEIAEGAKKPPWSQAAAALAVVGPKAPTPVRDEMERLRTVARQVRDGVRGVLRRQEFQRAIASGSLHPAVASLVGDGGEFLAGLLPPIADAAREPLTPYLLTALRAPADDVRAKILGFLQRRWREVAAAPLGGVARTTFKPRDVGIALAAVRALAALGAHDDLVTVTGAMSGAVRGAALGELAKVAERGALEADGALVNAALTRAVGDPDASVRARAEMLLRARGA